LRSQATAKKTREPASGVQPPTAWVDFLRAHAALTRRMDAALRERHELSLNEFEVLLHLWLADEGHLRRVDLADRLLITQGGVTRLLAGLEGRGLVERASCETDGRVVYAKITTKGSRLLERARQSHFDDVGRLFSDNFSERELSNLGEMLARLRDPGDSSDAC
jgi:DNA-binding MarR family transcriptional regulator